MHIDPLNADLRDVPDGEVFFYIYRDGRLWSIFVRRRQSGSFTHDDSLDNSFAFTRRGAIRRGRRMARRYKQLKVADLRAEVFRA